MGLSAYGSDEGYADSFTVTDHSIHTSTSRVLGLMSVHFCRRCLYWLQKSFENGMIALLQKLRKYHLDGNVCFAGGTFLNILANTKIKQSGIFDNIHIHPFTDDAGIL